MIPKRLFWWSSGYAAGAASSWWVQRKVKRTVETVPDLVKKEMTGRVVDAGRKAKAQANATPVVRAARDRFGVPEPIVEPEPTPVRSAKVIDLRRVTRRRQLEVEVPVDEVPVDDVVVADEPERTVDESTTRTFADRAASLRERTRR